MPRTTTKIAAADNTQTQRRRNFEKGKLRVAEVGRPLVGLGWPEDVMQCILFGMHLCIFTASILIASW